MKPLDRQWSPHAELFVPSSGGIDAMKWRFGLIKRMKTWDVEHLRSLLKMGLEQGPSRKLTSEATKVARAMVLDEVDEALILATAFLANAETKTVESVAQFHPDFKSFTKNLGYSKSEAADILRPSLAMMRNGLLKYEIPRIRAKVAVLEVLCTLPRRPTFLNLVAFSPIYLQSEVTFPWVRYYQERTRFGSDADKKDARLKLKEFQKAIAGDGRRMRPRNAKHWGAHLHYLNLCDWLESFRYYFGKGRAPKSTPPFNFPRDMFDQYFEEEGISDVQKLRVLNGGKGHGIGEIALEILTDCGVIASPKAFREFQAEKAKLAKRHSWIGHTKILDRMLDLPHLFPKLQFDCPRHKVLSWCK